MFEEKQPIGSEPPGDVHYDFALKRYFTHAFIALHCSSRLRGFSPSLDLMINRRLCREGPGLLASC